MLRWLRRRPSPPLAAPPYRAPPAPVPTPPRSAFAALGLALAVGGASFSCCLGTGLYGLAIDGPGVGTVGFTMPAYIIALAAAWVAIALKERARLRPAENALLLAAVPVMCIAGGAYSHPFAASSWERGCARRVARSCHDASKAYQYGIGVVRDRAVARGYARDACSLGDQFSCLELLRDDPTAAPPRACDVAAILCGRAPRLASCEGFNARCPPAAR